MGWGYDHRRDMMTGHDYPGVCGHGMHQYTIDELELGARAAFALDDPQQWWWELISSQLDQEANGILQLPQSVSSDR